jgi:hypothetical protein
MDSSRSCLKLVAKSSLIPPHPLEIRSASLKPAGSNSSPKAHNAFAVRLPRYFRAPRCGFFSLDCRSLRALRLGLLMAKVPLP